MNAAFRDHVTSAAFQLALSGPMVHMLALVIELADRDAPYRGCGDRALHGLERRGLICASTVRGPLPGQPQTWVAWLPTIPGRLVAELAKQAGLLEGGDADPLIDEMRRQQQVRAEAERVASEEDERRHAEFIASIRLKAKQSGRVAVVAGEGVIDGRPDRG